MPAAEIRLFFSVSLKLAVFGKYTIPVNVSLKLIDKPSGRIIWIVVDPKDLKIKSYRWFGSVPDESLPDISEMKTAKHVRANAVGIKAERPGHQIVPLSRFEQLPTMDAVLDRLFGRLH